jgi:pyruvate dehydrogenase E1 component beta subunit
LAAQHSHSWEPFAHVPGLIVLSAGTRRCPKYAACRSSKYRPCDSVRVYFLIEYGKEIPEEATPVTITEAKVRREGKDISIITYGAAVYKCLEAANELAKIGIEAEVVDLRVLRLWTKPLSWLPFQNTSGNYCGRSLAFRQYFC